MIMAKYFSMSICPKGFKNDSKRSPFPYSQQDIYIGSRLRRPVKMQKKLVVKNEWMLVTAELFNIVFNDFEAEKSRYRQVFNLCKRDPVCTLSGQACAPQVFFRT